MKRSILFLLLFVAASAPMPPQPAKVTLAQSPRAKQLAKSMGTPMAVVRPPPAPLLLGWVPSTKSWSNFTLYVGHASGLWTEIYPVNSTNVTLTNFNKRAGYVFQVSQTDSNGITSWPSPELWVNIPSNGVVWTSSGMFNLAFPVASNVAYQVRDWPTSNLLMNVQLKSNAVALYQEQMVRPSRIYLLQHN